MVWARLDDKFHTHPKVAELDPTPVMAPLMAAALGLHMLALSWCADQLTDGIVPRTQPARLIGGAVDNLIEELVRVGLWEKKGRGYFVHDYLDYNPSRAQVEARKTAQSEAGKRGAHARWHSGIDSPPHEVPHDDPIAPPIGDPIGDPIAHPIGSRCDRDAPDTRIPIPITEEIEKPSISSGTQSAPNEVDDFAGIDFGEDEGPDSDDAEEAQNTDPPDQEHAPPRNAKKNGGPPKAKAENAGTLVAYLVERATEIGFVLTDTKKGHFAKAIGDLWKAGSDPPLIRRAIEVALDENKSPRHLVDIVNDLKGGTRGRARADSGRSTNGEW